MQIQFSEDMILSFCLKAKLCPALCDSLEKEIAAHSRILAWEIPWAEETARLNSMMSQRAGHNLAFKQKLSIISSLN